MDKKFKPGDIVINDTYIGAENLSVVGYTMSGKVIVETLCKPEQVLAYPENELALVSRTEEAIIYYAFFICDDGSISSVTATNKQAFDSEVHVRELRGKKFIKRGAFKVELKIED